jgi:hypothetical protein
MRRMIMLLNVTLNPFVLPLKRGPALRRVRKRRFVYKAMPKIARRPPASTGVAYWASEAAAALLGEEAAPLAPAEVAAGEPLVREAEPEAEPELEAAGVLDLVVRLPHVACEANSH